MEKQNTIDKIRNFFQKPESRLLLFFGLPIILLAIIFTVITVLSMNSTPKEPKTTIENLTSLLPNLPIISEQQIEQQLYKKIQYTLPDLSNIPTSGAYARPNSLFLFDINSSFYIGDFVVDIESIKQSYIVQFFYGKSPNNQEMEISASVKIFCTEEHPCKESASFTRYNPIQFILPKDFPEDHFSLSYSLSSNNTFYIIATLNPPESVYLSGDTDAFEKEVSEKIKSFLKSYNLNPNEYQILYKYKIIR